MSRLEPLSNFAAYTEGRQNNFDFLRFILALSVIFSHCYAVLGYSARPLSSISRGQIDLGAAAVNGFFVISGFLITASWMRSKGLASYLQKRILRIYPGFLAAALICLIVGAIASPARKEYLHNIRWFPFLGQALRLKIMEVHPTFDGLPMTNIVNGST